MSVTNIATIRDYFKKDDLPDWLLGADLDELIAYLGRAAEILRAIPYDEDARHWTCIVSRLLTDKVQRAGRTVGRLDHRRCQAISRSFRKSVRLLARKQDKFYGHVRDRWEGTVKGILQAARKGKAYDPVAPYRML